MDGNTFWSGKTALVSGATGFFGVELNDVGLGFKQITSVNFNVGNRTAQAARNRGLMDEELAVGESKATFPRRAQGDD